MRGRARRAWPALLQRRRRRPARPRRSVHQGGDASHQGRGRSRARAAPENGCLRHRLSDAGRHLHPRLHSRLRSRRRAFERARLSARRRRRDDAQLRLRPRFFRAGCDRGRETGLGRRFQGRVRGPAGRRSRPDRSAADRVRSRSDGSRNSTTWRPSSPTRWRGSAAFRSAAAEHSGFGFSFASWAFSTTTMRPYWHPARP